MGESSAHGVTHHPGTNGEARPAPPTRPGLTAS